MLCTWNVNMARPNPQDDLTSLFTQVGHPPDIVCIGFQGILTRPRNCDYWIHVLTMKCCLELDMTAEGLVMKETGRAGPWVEFMRYTLDLAYCKMMVRSMRFSVLITSNWCVLLFYRTSQCPHETVLFCLYFFPLLLALKNFLQYSNRIIFTCSRSYITSYFSCCGCVVLESLPL